MKPDQEQIYYGIDGNRHGPVAPEEIRELVRRGRLRLTDFLWDDERNDWVPVGDFPQLASLASVEGAPSLPPTSAEGEAWGRDEAVSPPPGTGFAPNPDLHYGGFWERLFAHLLDTVVIAPLLFAWMFLALRLAGLDIDSMADEGWNPSATPSQAELRYVAWFYGGAHILEWLYRSILEASVWQATVGKRAFGMVVTDTAGDRISFARASMRHWAKLLSQITFYFGFLMIAITDQKQGLHDRVADTLVIKDR